MLVSENSEADWSATMTSVQSEHSKNIPCDSEDLRVCDSEDIRACDNKG